ncbi:MAG: hypothetical protein WBB65_13545, partial [Anaerolineales bacterium]
MSTDQKDIASLPIKGNLTLIYVLTFILAMLMATASVAGLLCQTIVYPTEELLQSFLANDVANLLIGLPMLLGSM